MTKVLTICLLFIFSVTQTEVGQLLKLPFLFEHYHKHQRLNQALSFLDFLKDHYSKEHKDMDQKEDRKLPFLSTISPSSNVVIVPIATLLQKPFKLVMKEYFLLNDQYHLPQVFYPIFHPPQAIVG